ncbi:Alpha/Beta hydrolase protein [Mycena vitilis]|nr:Alpha/Beta hydrolase protein [Mycena vitilis]
MSPTPHYVPYSVLVPSVLAACYILASLPTVQSNRVRKLPGPAKPGLASLPLNSRARVVYSEDFLEGGAYAQVRYWLIGPADGKKIVFVHGISTPALAFTRLAPILADAGYRVLLYDLYGRGYSDAPQGVAYDAQLYVTQLALLLQHLQWTRARLLGFSMGGSISAAFVTAFPALVERDVVLIASAGGTAPPLPSAAMKLRHWPFVERLTTRKVIASMTPKTFTSPMPELVSLQAAHLPGYAHAVAASLYDGLIAKLDWAFSSQSWRGRRVLLINVGPHSSVFPPFLAEVTQGDRDTVIPPAAAPVLQEMLASAAAPPLSPNSISIAKVLPPPEVSLVPVVGAGHDLTWTHAEGVARAVLDFLHDGERPAAVEQE